MALGEGKGPFLALGERFGPSILGRGRNPRG